MDTLRPNITMSSCGLIYRAHTLLIFCHSETK
jgi:hypothetical protein